MEGRRVLNQIKRDRLFIVSHKTPHHLDDLIAISIIAADNDIPNDQIFFMHPQNDKEYLEELKQMKNVFVIDIGGDYNPEYNNFDHHQDKNIESSFMLILKHFYPEYYNIIHKYWEKSSLFKELMWIDYRDRFGYPTACKEFGITGSIFMESMIKIIADEYLYFSDLGRIILKLIHKEYYNFSVIEKMEIKEYKGIKYIVTDNNNITAGNIFNLKDIDLLIQKNSMDPNDTSIIKNSKSLLYDKIDLSKIKDILDVKFIHPNGFIAVIPKNIKNIDPKKIIEVVYNE